MSPEQQAEVFWDVRTAREMVAQGNSEDAILARLDAALELLALLEPGPRVDEAIIAYAKLDVWSTGTRDLVLERLPSGEMAWLRAWRL